MAQEARGRALQATALVPTPKTKAITDEEIAGGGETQSTRPPRSVSGRIRTASFPSLCAGVIEAILLDKSGFEKHAAAR